MWRGLRRWTGRHLRLAQAAKVEHMDRYDAAHIAAFFDAYGEREWNRFAAAPHAEVNLHLLCHDEI